MPQLSLETFVSQYFWLVVVILGLYYINTERIIPRISKIRKAREIGELKGQTKERKVESKVENVGKYKRRESRGEKREIVWEI